MYTLMRTQCWVFTDPQETKHHPQGTAEEEMLTTIREAWMIVSLQWDVPNTNIPYRVTETSWIWPWEKTLDALLYHSHPSLPVLFHSGHPQYRSFTLVLINSLTSCLLLSSGIPTSWILRVINFYAGLVSPVFCRRCVDWGHSCLQTDQTDWWTGLTPLGKPCRRDSFHATTHRELLFPVSHESS